MARFTSSQGQKKRPRPLSEYGKELKEKQKLKKLYNLREAQFRKYVKEVLRKRRMVEDPTTLLVKRLENRLDNVVFRLGFAKTRVQARQLVNHGHFSVNDAKVNIPSYQIKKDDKITILPKKLQKKIFQNLSTTLKKHEPPSWLELDKEKLKGKVVGEPSVEEASLPIEIPAIFEFYSR